MAIQTNIDVRAFNIIRYLLLNIVVDILVRTSLDSFEHFRRRLSLYRGRSVSVAGLRIDRYNVISTLKSAHKSVPKCLPTIVLFLVAFVAYGVEIALEYAVDSSAIRYPNRGIITRAQYEMGVCSLDALFTNSSAPRLAFIAEQCVVAEGSTYRLYKPVWTRAAPGSFGLLCEAAEGNRLFEGDGVYSAPFESEDTPEIEQLVQSLHDHSYKSIGDLWHSLMVINVSSNHVFATKMSATPLARFSVVFFATLIPGTRVECFGFGSGRLGEGSLLLQVVGCANGFDENSSLVLTSGTSLVQLGTENERDGSAEWSTLVPFEIRFHIPYFFRGLAVEGSSSDINATAYASFLARSFPQDVINLNKYAIVYRFCDQIPMPVENGSFWEEEYEFASSEMRVTATVEEWGIVLAICWVVAVTVAQFVVRWLAARRGMPDKLLGESHILRRWAEENGWENSVQERSGQAFLSVGDGWNTDHITATLRRRTVQRDESKPFS